MAARPGSRRRLFRELIIGIAALAAIGYLVIGLAPNLLALIIPASWWAGLGETAERAFTGGARRCASAEGEDALAALLSRLDRSGGTIQAIGVFEIPVANAWALPGGRMILTRRLIESAGDAGEVAGVMAHEIGHIRSRHAEAQLIRAIGIDVLFGLSNGSGVAGALAALRYSREAEREADAIAAELMIDAGIDTAALTRFLTRMKEWEGESDWPLSRIFDILSTHPVTDERIAAVPEMPSTAQRLPALDPDQWQALQAICS